MATEHQRIEDVGDGLSRRQVLARGAVAAGIVWAAPVIRTASAYATSAAGTERPCSKFYLVCLDKYGPRPIRFLNPEEGYDEMPAASVLARFRPVEEPAPTTTTSSTSSTTTSSTSSTTTSSTSSTTTSSTSSTTTTTTLPPFDDPTAGLGLFPGDESSTDPRDKKRRKKEEDKNRKRRKKNTANPDDEDELDPTIDEDVAPIDPTSEAIDELGLFPEEQLPTEPVAAPAAELAPDVLPSGIKQWLEDNPDVPVRYPEVPPMLTQTGDQAWAVLLPAVEEGPNPLTHQCRAVKGWSQAGDRHAEFYEDPEPIDTVDEGRRLIFPNPVFDDTTKDAGVIERVFVVYCCP